MTYVPSFAPATPADLSKSPPGLPARRPVGPTAAGPLRDPGPAAAVVVRIADCVRRRP